MPPNSAGARPSDREAFYKRQAAALRDFLAAGGVDLKQVNALAAIAKVHGAPDWHTLVNGHQPASAPAAEAAPAARPESGEIYVVVSHFRGVSTASYAASRELALLDFIQAARMFADILGPDELFIVGQDMDAGLPCMSLFAGELVLLELIRPDVVRAETIVQDSDGSAHLERAKAVNLRGLHSLESFQQIALALNAAFSVRTAEEAERRFKRSVHTQAARMLSFNGLQAMKDLSLGSSASSQPFQFDAAQLLRAIDRVKVMHSVKLTVSGDKS